MPVKKKKTEALTKRQEKFVEAMADPTVKTIGAAARRAGYASGTANVIASQNLKKLNVQDAITKRKQELAAHADVTAAQVMGATARIAFASVVDALDEKGEFDFKRAKKSGAADLIKKITKKHGEFGTDVSVEFYPKDAALAKLGDYLGMKTDSRPNPLAAALKILETIQRTENCSLQGAITKLITVQNEKQVELVPVELLREVARANGIMEIEGVQ